MIQSDREWATIRNRGAGGMGAGKPCGEEVQAVLAGLGNAGWRWVAVSLGVFGGVSWDDTRGLTVFHEMSLEWWVCFSTALVGTR